MSSMYFQRIFLLAFKRGSDAALYALIAFLVSACSSEKPRPQINGFTMGTSYSIQWSDKHDINVDQLQYDIDMRLQDINALMSTYLEDSELSRLNQSQQVGWHNVDLELASLVKLALEICKYSAGALDITVGPLVNLWGFGAVETHFEIPTQNEVNQAKRTVGCQHLEVQINPPAINKKIAELYIDLSAIAKGYAVDELAEILDAYDLEHYMVEIGGEVKAKGLAPHGNPWRIGIETPEENRGHLIDIVSLKNIAIATSGDYRNYFLYEGQRYSHTINPSTGLPVKHEVASVTILNTSTALADAWATAFMVLGANDSLRLAKELNLTGLFVTRHGNEFKQTIFGDMQDYLAE